MSTRSNQFIYLLEVKLRRLQIKLAEYRRNDAEVSLLLNSTAIIEAEKDPAVHNFATHCRALMIKNPTDADLKNYCEKNKILMTDALQNYVYELNFIFDAQRQIAETQILVDQIDKLRDHLKDIRGDF